MLRKNLFKSILLIILLFFIVVASNQCNAQFPFPLNPLAVANQAGTWIGQWYIPNSGVIGQMTLDIVEDPFTGAATAFAVLELNPFLGAGVSLNGTISNNIAILQGSVLTPYGPKPLAVNMTCTLYSPTLLTGTYQIADYQGGSVKVFEVGLFELSILPSLLSFQNVIVPPIAPPTLIPTPVLTTVPVPAATPIVSPILAAPALTTAVVPPVPTTATAVPTAAISALLPLIPFFSPTLLPPLALAEQNGTWVGQWLVPSSGVAGNMTLNIVEDPLTGAASGFALLELNPLLQAGVALNGSISNNIVILAGSIQTIVGPKPVQVDMICTLDSPIHMTGTYRVADYLGGSVKIFEEGIFDLSLLPSLIIP